MNYKEIETKYDADHMSFPEFEAFCLSRKPARTVVASGYDYFYAFKKEDESFARHRVGPDLNQVTFKRKTDSSNNYVRTEHNITIHKKMEVHQVNAFLNEFGYSFRNKIFKNVFVYEFPMYTFVYYVCYDSNLSRLGSFVEIEMSETYAWESVEHAWLSLQALELQLGKFGINPKRRLKKSLFEMFKK